MARKKTQVEPKESVEFLNPFNKGVSFAQFVEAIKQSGKNLDEYSKNKLSGEQIAWLKKEIKILNTLNNGN
jgi:hypothetical protein